VTWQWVFTVPKPLRLVLAREPAWTSWIGGLVVRAIGAWQRRAAPYAVDRGGLSKRLELKPVGRQECGDSTLPPHAPS
jgi:hypothetical protein